MPANKKYLEQSGWQRFLKISAGILGGYLVSTTLHMALAFLFPHKEVLITITYTGFILWVILMILAFLAKSGYRIWGIYLGLALLFSIAIYCGKLINPIL